MKLASLELCKELYHLSRWKDCTERYTHNSEMLDWILNYDGSCWWLPAYDLGYLMRSLPDGFTIVTRFNEGWLASWAETAQAPDIAVEAATPEDAAAKLAIELFKQGVLVKDPA